MAVPGKLGVPNATGKIRKAAKFDAAHFGIHRKQVLSLDPMTCLVLERSFEAICDAGTMPHSSHPSHLIYFYQDAESNGPF
jgi:acyl transferase domain-containing protein